MRVQQLSGRERSTLLAVYAPEGDRECTFRDAIEPEVRFRMVGRQRDLQRAVASRITRDRLPPTVEAIRSFTQGAFFDWTSANAVSSPLARRAESNRLMLSLRFQRGTFAITEGRIRFRRAASRWL
jgi:hypothetical protein